jgi:hypothetical protein
MHATMKTFQLIAAISVLATFSPVASFAFVGSQNGAISRSIWKAFPTTTTTELNAEGGRINTKIDLESPKVILYTLHRPYRTIRIINRLFYG